MDRHRQSQMQTIYKEIYSNSNGDRWLLAREPDSGNFREGCGECRIWRVRQPMELDAFLTREKHAPQVNRLIVLIGSLVPESTD